MTGDRVARSAAQTRVSEMEDVAGSLLVGCLSETHTDTHTHDPCTYSCDCWRGGGAGGDGGAVAAAGGAGGGVRDAGAAAGTPRRPRGPRGPRSPRPPPPAPRRPRSRHYCPLATYSFTTLLLAPRTTL